MPQLWRDNDFIDYFVLETAVSWMQNLDSLVGVAEDQLDDSLAIRNYVEDRLGRVVDDLYDELVFNKQFSSPAKSVGDGFSGSCQGARRSCP